MRDPQETLPIMVTLYFLSWMVVYGCSLYSLYFFVYLKCYIVVLKSICKWLQCGDHKYKYTGQMKTPVALMLPKWIVVA